MVKSFNELTLELELAITADALDSCNRYLEKLVLMCDRNADVKNMGFDDMYELIRDTLKNSFGGINGK